jgi:hypothetical protein
MRIRNYTAADIVALRRLHAAQGFGYPFPDLDSPLFVTKLVIEDDEDEAPEKNGDGEGREELSLNSPPEEVQPDDSLTQSVSRNANPPRIRMAVLLRLTAEAYLLHDATAGTPRQRWQNLLALHEAVRQHALSRGLDDVQAFLPPRIAQAFGRRLARLGWRQDPWPCFSKQVTGSRC